MFYKATAFNSDISAWNVSKGTRIRLQQNVTNYLLTIFLPFHLQTVKSMAGMFDQAGFNSNISAWDVSHGRYEDFCIKTSLRWMTKYLLII